MSGRRETYYAGQEALLLLAYLEKHPAAGELEEKQGPYGLLLESMQAHELVELIRQAKELLSKKSFLDQAEAAPLFITRDFRIFLGSRHGEEIRMRPMSKAVFLLFLKHPEGIDFKEISSYKAELRKLYARVSRKGTNEEIDRCLERILDSGSHELNVAASRIAESMAGRIDRELLPSYVISGERGGRKQVRLDRRLVVWL